MSAAVTIDTPPRAWNSGTSDRARAFRAARRHSRWVRLLRVALPASVVVVVCGYGLLTWLNPWTALSRLPLSGKLAVLGTKITMESPRLAGFTREGRAYELTANAAAQDLRRPHVIELKEIRAKVEMQDDTVINVTASTGVYDTKTEIATLNENVIVTASSGTQIRLAEARLDVRKGHILSEKPVEVVLPNGRIDAKVLEVSGGGEVVQFRGGVTMVVTPESGQGPPQAVAKDIP